MRPSSAVSRLMGSRTCGLSPWRSRHANRDRIDQRQPISLSVDGRRHAAERPAITTHTRETAMPSAPIRRNTCQHVTSSSVEALWAWLHAPTVPRRFPTKPGSARRLRASPPTKRTRAFIWFGEQRLTIFHLTPPYCPWSLPQSVACPPIDRRQNRLTLPIILIIGRHALASGSTSRNAIGPPSNRNSLKRRLC